MSMRERERRERTNPKRRPARDWKRQRATTKGGARSLTGTTTLSSSAERRIESEREGGRLAFFAEATRLAGWDPARVGAFEVLATEGSLAGSSMLVGKGGEESWMKSEEKRKEGGGRRGRKKSARMPQQSPGRAGSSILR
jgi:hypothetical protein